VASPYGALMMRSDNTVDCPLPEESGAGAQRLRTLLALGLASAIALFALNGHHAGFLWLNGLSRHLSPTALEILTLFGDAMMLCVILLALLHRYPRFVWASTLGLISSAVVVRLLKWGFNLPRPPAVLDASEFILIGPGWAHNSFPSGHSLSVALVTATALYYIHRPRWIWGLVGIAIAVGLSRVLVGVHWPVDVFAGASLGIACAWLGITWARHWNAGMTAQGRAVLWLLLTTASSLPFVYDGGYQNGIIYCQVLAAFVIVYTATREARFWWQRSQPLEQPSNGRVS
jgi:membrane-associated phospholipid phosphatase